MIKTYFGNTDRGSPHCVPTRARSRRSAVLPLEHTTRSRSDRQRFIVHVYTAAAGTQRSRLAAAPAFVFVTTVYIAPKGDQPQQGSLHICTQTVHQTRTWKIKPKGLDFNERKNISNIILGVSNGLVKKYFWYRKASPYKRTSARGLTCWKLGARMSTWWLAPPCRPTAAPQSPHSAECPCCERTRTTPGQREAAEKAAAVSRGSRLGATRSQGPCAWGEEAQPSTQTNTQTRKWGPRLRTASGQACPYRFLW